MRSGQTEKPPFLSDLETVEVEGNHKVRELGVEVSTAQAPMKCEPAKTGTRSFQDVLSFQGRGVDGQHPVFVFQRDD